MRKIITAAALAAAVLFSGCASSYPENEQEYLDFVKETVNAEDPELLDRGYMYCSMMDLDVDSTPMRGDETVIRYASTRWLCPEHR